MLPILRIISVGGVFLAIAILILALNPPGGAHLGVSRQEIGARGALVDQGQHPEWRQFLIQSALRRAGELERLRTLPSSPAPSVPPVDEPQSAATSGQRASDVAGLPTISHEAASDDVTGSIDENPGATIPIDIGEASSTELPVIPAEERPPVSRLPSLQLPEAAPPASAPASETTGTAKKTVEPPRRAVQQRARRKPVPAPAPAIDVSQVPPPFNILIAIFGGLARAESTKAMTPAENKAAAAKPARSSNARQASGTLPVAQ